MRVLVVTATASVVVIMIFNARRGHRSRPLHSVDVSSLEIGRGVVMFTSSSCATCADARSVADRVLGAVGYEERSWEQDADALAAAGVDEVPLTVIVNRRGRVRAVLRGRPHPLRLRIEALLARF